MPYHAVMRYSKGMATEVQRPLADVLKELRQYLEKCGQSQSALAKFAGINQSTVHRALLSPKPRRRLSAALKKLCIYAEISLTEVVDADPAQNEELMGAVRLAWDGTEVHATALARVIRELARLSGRSGTEAPARRGNRKNG